MYRKTAPALVRKTGKGHSPKTLESIVIRGSPSTSPDSSSAAMMFPSVPALGAVESATAAAEEALTVFTVNPKQSTKKLKMDLLQDFGRDLLAAHARNPDCMRAPPPSPVTAMEATFSSPWGGESLSSMMATALQSQPSIELKQAKSSDGSKKSTKKRKSSQAKQAAPAKDVIEEDSVVVDISTPRAVMDLLETVKGTSSSKSKSPKKFARKNPKSSTASTHSKGQKRVGARTPLSPKNQNISSKKMKSSAGSRALPDSSNSLTVNQVESLCVDNQSNIISCPNGDGLICYGDEDLFPEYDCCDWYSRTSSKCCCQARDRNRGGC